MTVIRRWLCCCRIVVVCNTILLLKANILLTTDFDEKELVSPLNRANWRRRKLNRTIYVRLSEINFLHSGLNLILIIFKFILLLVIIFVSLLYLILTSEMCWGQRMPSCLHLSFRFLTVILNTNALYNGTLEKYNFGNVLASDEFPAEPRCSRVLDSPTITQSAYSNSTYKQ